MYLGNFFIWIYFISYWYLFWPLLFPATSFSLELSYPYFSFQYQHTIIDLSFLVITLSPPDEPTYLASTSCIPSIQTRRDVIILLVFRKFLYSNLFDFLLISVLTSSFPCNLFFPGTVLSLFILPIPTPNHWSIFLVITHSPPNVPTYLTSTSHIPSSDLNILTTSVVNEHRI